MTHAGPYRARLDEPDSVDGFWTVVHRRRRWRRALPLIMGILALTPAVAIAVSARTPPRLASSWDDIESLRSSAQGTWGLEISGALVRTSRASWRGGPAPRPSLEDSPISADTIQAAVLERGSELHECYVRSAAFQSETGGTLVASLLIKKDGEVVPAVGGDDELRRTGVAACVRDVLDRLSFPAQSDYAWVHLPLRFEP